MRPIRVDARIVAATNDNLPRAVEEGRFRADLLDRLSFEVVTLPPLRHRISDIPVLADHFARRIALEMARNQWTGFSTTEPSRHISYDRRGKIGKTSVGGREGAND